MTTIPLIAMYNYDNTIFDNLQVPTKINREILINSILDECNEFELIYNEPSYLKFIIGTWSSKMLDKWQDMINVLNVDDYDPFINLERHEVETNDETRHLENNEIRNLLNNQTRNLSNNQTSNMLNNQVRNLTTNQNGSTTEDGTSEEQISAWNETTYQNRNKTITSNSQEIENVTTDTGSINETSNGRVESNDVGNIRNEDNGTITNTDEGTIYNTRKLDIVGDSAMFSKQDIIEKEMNLRKLYNIYDIIINDFVNKFCLQIY